MLPPCVEHQHGAQFVQVGLDRRGRGQLSVVLEEKLQQHRRVSFGVIQTHQPSPGVSYHAGAGGVRLNTPAIPAPAKKSVLAGHDVAELTCIAVFAEDETPTIPRTNPEPCADRSVRYVKRRFVRGVFPQAVVDLTEDGPAAVVD